MMEFFIFRCPVFRVSTKKRIQSRYSFLSLMTILCSKPKKPLQSLNLGTIPSSTLSCAVTTKEASNTHSAVPNSLKPTLISSPSTIPMYLSKPTSSTSPTTPHTHFCMIRGKGFKRDANLRMHMRGHGDEYKTPSALAKPNKEPSSEPMLIKRYSCPYAGCKRNKDHRKFQPLKTILCVKNHYKRTHCDKSYTCSRCNNKKFSVMADLKTHEKHCGRDKWLCTCGTTFSRKDKLFGHVALFQGHAPAISLDEMKVVAAEPSDRGESNEEANKFGLTGLDSGSNVTTGNGVKGSGDDTASVFSPLTFDARNFSGYQELPRPPFDDSETSFSFLIPGSCNYPPKARGELDSNDLE